jgi:predicted nuclease of predicted toxin-antitoxin system
LKLLFDQNISPKIIKQLDGIFLEAKQVRHVGLEDASDAAIFDFAKANDFAIVTFDSDFVDLNVIRGIPPKIIWLKTGNMSTKAIALLLSRNIELIKEFLEPDQFTNEILEIITNDL